MKSLLLLLVLAAPARAITWPAGDYGGTNIQTSNLDVLSGTYTNVGLFSIPDGSTVSVATGINLVVYASTVSIDGVLTGTGSGAAGGNGGVASGAGTIGDSGGPSGGGAGAASPKGGGGGAGGGNGGAGAGELLGFSPAAGGTAYGAAGTPSGTVSPQDLFQGSGGGGGGGNSTLVGGSGAYGGGAIYIEAASFTVTGSILVDGSTAAAVAFGFSGTCPGGGGGGGGGTLILRVPGSFRLADGSKLSANGGKGGDVDSSFQSLKEPGGGGGGGRVKLFYSNINWGSVVLSTNAGNAGATGGGFQGTVDASTPPITGSSGTLTFGIVASSPTSFSALSVYVTSIDWNWSAGASFGDGASPAYRLYPASATLVDSAITSPLPPPMKTSATPGTTEQGLVPNTTYYRFVTAATAWGDSLPSTIVSTHTLAAGPAFASPAFTSMADTSLTANWTGGANSTSTVYELDASINLNFSAPVSTSLLMFASGVSPSSAPVSLSPNTTYYFRVRAINIDGVPTSYAAAIATATLASVPSNPQPGTVYVTSVAFSWSGGANPAGTMYTAQALTGVPLSVVASSNTLMTSATFFGLVPGTTYSLQVFAVNSESVPTAAVSTVAVLGNQSNTSPPGAPGTPNPDRQFSYDGSLGLSWTPASSPVGILDYNLIVGSLPGGSDFFQGNVAVTSFSAVGLSSGKTYYAQVRARSNAGIYGAFSGVSLGVPVFITSQVQPIPKPINWPNPFNPANGPTQIGFFIDSPGSVTLKIYTLQGRLVAQFSQSFSVMGNQIMTWDGTGSGGRVAPGGYVLVVEKHLATGTSSQRGKIAVLY